MTQNLVSSPAPLPADSPVSRTVYSVVWPQTEALVRRVFQEETEQLLERHRDAHTGRQDAMHAPFFEAWRAFAAPAVRGLEQFSQAYPSAGSSEAIREIIRQAGWKQQALVGFEGEYEGYEAIARPQGTAVVAVDRRDWRAVLARWQAQGVPWGPGGAQWWVSQPSAIDGNDWPEFSEWLDAAGRLPGLEIWVDLTYVGRARLAQAIDLSDRPAVAGVVFSLSKVMGAYYRRIGGALAREPVEGLWANRWFKSLDALYLGQRWLEQAGNALVEGRRHSALQRQAMTRALSQLGGPNAWRWAGVEWRASDVPLLMHAQDRGQSPAAGLAAQAWAAAARGPAGRASRRLCLTPSLVALLQAGAP